MRTRAAASSTAAGTCPTSRTSPRRAHGREPRGGRRLPVRAPHVRDLRGLLPNAGEEEQVLAQPLNTKPKHVASRTLTEPLEWHNSTLLQGDLAEAVAALKQEDG